jgi:hypothetical protein
MRAALVLLLVLAGCGGDIEKENVATTHDAGNPDLKDASGPTLDATVTDGGAPKPGGDGGTTSAVCTNDSGCNGGTCFEGTCLCALPKYVQSDGRCGDAQPPDCATSSGTCRQNPATCMAGELEGELGTNQSCGDFVAAVCCFPAASCKSTVDFVCCGASTTPYEPSCVNGWRQCMGLMPKLRSDKCP